MASMMLEGKMLIKNSLRDRAAPSPCQTSPARETPAPGCSSPTPAAVSKKERANIRANRVTVFPSRRVARLTPCATAQNTVHMSTGITMSLRRFTYTVPMNPIFSKKPGHSSPKAAPRAKPARLSTDRICCLFFIPKCTSRKISCLLYTPRRKKGICFPPGSVACGAKNGRPRLCGFPCERFPGRARSQPEREAQGGGAPRAWRHACGARPRRVPAALPPERAPPGLRIQTI